jgi:hypothetical protein
MFHAALLCFALIGDGGSPAVISNSDRVAYKAAAAKADKNSAAHVQLALWCEAHGMTDERIKHLNLAVSFDPSNTLAQGLLGMVAFHGKWGKPEQVKREIQIDPEFQAVFREYLDRRARTPQKADSQLRLANWCWENGLKDEATVHYYSVTRLDPSRDIAWLRLGYKKQRDRWQKPEVLAAKKLEADRHKRDDALWKPRLEKLREAMASTVESRRLKAERELYQISDPSAGPMIFKTFGSRDEQMQLLAVELLSQLDGQEASSYVLALAIGGQSGNVREHAASVIARRDPRDSIARLIALVRKPFKFEIKPLGGPGSTGALLVEGERFDIRRVYKAPDVEVGIYAFGQLDAITGNLDDSFVVISGNPRTPVERIAVAMQYQFANQLQGTILLNEAIRRSNAVKQTLDGDVQFIQDLNAQIVQTNDRALPLLATLTGQQFGVDPPAWRTWWADQLGLVVDDRYAEAKPTLSQFVSPKNVGEVHHHSCFAAGTLVQTLGGPRNIESILPGDRVLAQDTSSGALAYQPVLATHVNGPAGTLRIKIDRETIVATGIHRFWTAGRGWTMARDLKAGDHLRMIDGIVTIQSIEPGPTEKVYNLTVAENRDFLVGTAGLLVHDYSFVLPVSEPFDRLGSSTPVAAK